VARYGGLHAAAHRGDVAALQLLAPPAPTLNAARGAGRTPCTWPPLRASARRCAPWPQAGPTWALENDRYDAVTIAAVADDEPTLRVLLAWAPAPSWTTSRYDGTALIAAAHLGHDGVVRQLIAAGAPLDHVNNLHWTAVIEAIVLGDGGPRHQATLKALLRRGRQHAAGRPQRPHAAAAGPRCRCWPACRSRTTAGATAVSPRPIPCASAAWPATRWSTASC
jgi:ankyrin repeat protein